MGNINDIKERIVSVRSTKQITNAMKMVAAAKMRKAQQNMFNARPYSKKIMDLTRIVRMKNRGSDNLYLNETNPSGKILYIFVTADRGLCGSFNGTITRTGEQLIEENPNCDLICIGKKSHDYFRKRTDKVIAHFVGLMEKFEFSNTSKIADKIQELYLSNEYSKVVVIFNEFVSVLQQSVKELQLLPIPTTDSEERVGIDYLYEPDADTVIDNLVQRYLHFQMWQMFLESSASEQSSRMTAMDNATENAKDLISSLQLQYNRERQASITTEIIEVASGAEAINS